MQSRTKIFLVLFASFFALGAQAAKDVTPPEITELRTTQGGPETSGVPVLYFAAIDKESGIDHFEASFGGGPFVKVENPYPLDQLQATQRIALKAFDKAGNVSLRQTNFTPPEDKPYQKERQSSNAIENAVSAIIIAFLVGLLWRYLYL